MTRFMRWYWPRVRLALVILGVALALILAAPVGGFVGVMIAAMGG